MTPKAWPTTTKIDKLDCIKIENICAKGDNQQNENASSGIEGNICKSNI